MTAPDNRIVVAGDPDSSVQHDIEVQAVIANMDPALMLQFRELSVELANPHGALVPAAVGLCGSGAFSSASAVGASSLHAP